MKRTTYILIAMLAGTLLLPVAIVFYISTLFVPQESLLFQVDGEMKSIPLPCCAYLRVTTSAPEDEGGQEVLPHSRYAPQLFKFQNQTLTVCEAAAGQVQPTLTLAAGMERFVTLSQQGDTAVVSFNFPDGQIPEKLRGKRPLQVQSAAMTLAVPREVKGLDLFIASQETSLNGLERDSFSLRSYCTVHVKACRFHSFTPKAWQCGVYLESGAVTNLYVDLDDCYDWRVESDFTIDTEYLTGTRRHYCTLSPGECRRVVWTPKSPDGKLEVKLNQPAELLLK